MSFSFVHASDLQLGAPLFGVADLPDNLRNHIVDARYAAARSVFDLALAERVDAVVLAGGVIADCAGPRAMRFFTEQCERLEEVGISVFWSEAESGSQCWLQYVPLPDNVLLANPEVGQVFELKHDGVSAAALLTGALLPRHVPEEREIVRIGVVPDASASTLSENSGVDYWALGGRSQPGAVAVLRGMAQFSGTTQGESPDEPGPRGCVLVRAEEGHRLSSRFVPTAGIHWRDECISVDEDTDWSSIRGQLSERARGLSRSESCDAVMVHWTLRGHGIVWQQLLREDVNSQLLDELRQEFGQGTPPIWSLFLEPAADETQDPHRPQVAGKSSDSGHTIEDERGVPSTTASRCETTWGQGVVAVDASHTAVGEPHFQPSVGERATRQQVVSNAPAS